MNLIDNLTPKNTEEVKPGIFVQSRGNKNYRTINPIAWEGKWRLKKQFSWRNLLTIAIILFVAWSYFTETEFCRQLQKDPCELLPNITNYCFEQSNQQDFNILYDERGKNNFTLQINP